MSKADYERIIKRFWSAFEDFDSPMELFNEDSVYEDLGTEDSHKGLADIKAFWDKFYANTAREDFHAILDKWFVDDQGNYALEWTMKTVMHGEWGGNEAYGKTVQFRGASVGRIVNGIIVHHSDYWNASSVSKQLAK